MVEHATVNRVVEGSSPSSGAIKSSETWFFLSLQSLHSIRTKSGELKPDYLFTVSPYYAAMSVNFGNENGVVLYLGQLQAQFLIAL
jgi:hypothetical protein